MKYFVNIDICSEELPDDTREKAATVPKGPNPWKKVETGDKAESAKDNRASRKKKGDCLSETLRSISEANEKASPG
jgi:hypothetical protein